MKTLFVSSTFQDMQSERDAIRDIVLPRLNAEAQKYGQSVAVCDLRWGINTQNLEEASANRRVLDICLDEIDRSTSPMIVILGDRYGWIPPEDLIRSAAGQRRLVSGPHGSGSDADGGNLRRRAINRHQGQAGQREEYAAW